MFDFQYFVSEQEQRQEVWKKRIIGAFCLHRQQW